MPMRYFLLLLLVLAIPAAGEDGFLKNTRMEIRLNELVSSDVSQTGQTFTGTLNRSIPLGGKLNIQKGAQVSGVVRLAESTMNYYRPGTLELELTSIASNGKTYRIMSQTLRFQGKERRADPMTGKQDDHGARAEDVARAGIGTIGNANTSIAHTIPGTNIEAGSSNSTMGMQVILPAKSKLIFNVSSAD